MRNKILTRLALFLVASLLSGCAIIPLIPFLPTMGSAYEGYVFWKSGKATKYYAFDLETTYKAVMQASDQLKIEATLTNSVPKKKYSLETKGNIPMHIDIIRLKKSVTTVITSIPTFGDKHYVELFYKLVDDNLPKKAAVDKEKTS
ncbi:MAG: DUF3568 family protein [Smithella sp.]|nr:DUF3568 family protein [Syntrophaceae bacterium]